MKRIVSLLVAVSVVLTASISYAQSVNGRCLFPCLTEGPFKRATPPPPQTTPPQDEQPLNPPITFSGVTERAYANLERRIHDELPFVSCERDIMSRLKRANERIDGKNFIVDPNELSEYRLKSGDLLLDSQLRLMVAAAAAKSAGEDDLYDRFRAEACWVSKWRTLVETTNPSEAQRALWEKIAVIWARNGEFVGGSYLIKVEPYKRLVETYSPEAASAIQSGAVWSNIFGVDQLYSIDIPVNPLYWLYFKIIPTEFFCGDNGAPSEVTPHGDLQEKIKELVEELSVHD